MKRNEIAAWALIVLVSCLGVGLKVHSDSALSAPSQPAELQRVVLSLPQNGMLKLNGAEVTVVPTVVNEADQLSYTPNPNYFGVDSFTWKAIRGLLESNTADVTFSVDPVPDAPIAEPSNPHVLEDSVDNAVDLPVTDPDLLSYRAPTISGRVVLAATGAPMPDIELRYEGSSPNPGPPANGSVFTDERGRYTISLPYG